MAQNGRKRRPETKRMLAGDRMGSGVEVTRDGPEEMRRPSEPGNSMSILQASLPEFCNVGPSPLAKLTSLMLEVHSLHFIASPGMPFSTSCAKLPSGFQELRSGRRAGPRRASGFRNPGILNSRRSACTFDLANSYNRVLPRPHRPNHAAAPPAIDEPNLRLPARNFEIPSFADEKSTRHACGYRQRPKAATFFVEAVYTMHRAGFRAAFGCRVPESRRSRGVLGAQTPRCRETAENSRGSRAEGAAGEAHQWPGPDFGSGRSARRADLVL
jgi:hypothetical protein